MSDQPLTPNGPDLTAGVPASSLAEGVPLLGHVEGVSHPDDMATVCAIETTDGPRGALVDAFGTYASPIVSAFLQSVPIRPAMEAGAAGRA